VGFYWRAFQLGVSYQRKVSGIVNTIALPIYSRADDLDAVRRMRTRIVRSNATVIFPLLAVFIATAPELVPFVFGEQWRPSVVPAQILAVGGMVLAAINGMGALLLAIGHPRRLLYWNVACLVFYGGAVAVVASYGVTAVCVTVVVVYMVQFLAAHHFLLKPLLGVPVRQVLADLGPATVGSAAVLAAAWPLTSALAAADVPVPLLAAIVGAVSGAVYLGVLAAAFRSSFSDLVTILRVFDIRPRLRFAGRRIAGRTAAAASLMDR
jgi:O-antigen/teichoic acid export membrane protein